MGEPQTVKRRRFRIWWPFAGLGALIVLIVIVVAAGYFWLRGSLPEIDGEIALAGLYGPVTVVRDAHAIPHIFAGTRHDAYFSMGFVHAQDRLWQMESQRRVAAGRLSEIFGDRTLDTDRFLRTLGVYRAAEESLKRLAPDAIAAYEAYAAGVNAYLETRSGPLPPEFVMLSHEPEPWRAADSIAWLKMMAWDLGGNAFQEALRARLAKRLSAEQIEDLWLSYPEDGPTLLQGTLELYRSLPFASLAGVFPPPAPDGIGSNNWTVSGTQSETGKPLLANDPHLGLSMPGVFYLAHLSAPELEVIGATLPGLPNPLLGRTDSFAWGFTNTHPDVQDLFIERLDPDDPAQYLTPNGPQRFRERTETIVVKDGEDVTLTVRETRHGPVVSDLVGQSEAFVEAGHVLAFAWTALLPDDMTAQAAVRAVRARDWDEFVTALRDFHAPQQNIVFADVHGNIGFIAPARVPIRRSGDGWMPAPGWDGEHDWIGFVPYAALPRLFNPPSGRIFTANNRIVGPGYPYFLSRDWGPPFRAERIETLLSEREAHSLESFAAMQRDQRSLGARDLLPLLLVTVDPESEMARDAIGLLESWDAEMASDRPEPLIYMAWLREIVRALFADELCPDFAEYWRIRVGVIARALEPESSWCDNAGTPEAEDCAATTGRALEAALAFLTNRYGDDLNDWRWGEAHYAYAEHRVLGQIPGIGPWLEIRLPNGGEKDTLNAAGFKVANDSTAFIQNHGPVYRALYDLADLERSVFIQATGQSGNPFSPYYRDFAEPWRDGEYVPMMTDRAQIERSAIGTVQLTPE